MPSMHMHLKILLPFQVFADRTDVVRIVAETRRGAYGILPRRLDCVMALVPGILTVETQSGTEMFFVVDEGILVKTGAEVRVSVRNAIAGTELRGLRETVEREYLHLDEREIGIRTAMDKMETGLISRLAGFHHE